MLKKRLIAVLICRDGQVVQSVRFKHTNVIHYDPVHAMEAFNKWSIDEIVILNVSKNKESRKQFIDIVENISRHCFVPLAVGGWITDESYAQSLLRNGADKLVLNTSLYDNPELVSYLSSKYGKQCIVASVDVKRDQDDKLKVAVDRGKKILDIDPVSWVKKAVSLGVGEILFNSIDHDGARKGYDLKTLESICEAVNIPVIAFGGVFTWDHLVEGIDVGVSAVAVANQFHYTEHSTRKAKRYLFDSGAVVRTEGQALELNKIELGAV